VVAPGRTSGDRPAHRRRSLSESEARLRALGAHAPSLPEPELHALARERARRVVRRGLPLAVVVLAVGGLAAQWFRPVPAPAFAVSAPAAVRVPGPVPALPWPGAAAAAMAMEGAGSMGGAGPASPLPMGGLAKVMTSYVVLEDHPLATGASGPDIAVTPDDVAAFRADAASGQSVVPLTPGESLTELQALQGVLVASGNDVATLVAAWDAGSVPAFVAKMNADARRLGLDATTFTDPGGLDPGSRSTPLDMVRLGEAAMAVPALRAVVAMPQVTLPGTGILYNLDGDLGRDGFVGIKTGSDTAAGGCFLFAATRPVGPELVTIVGAILGLRGPSPTDDTLVAADTLVRAAFSAAHPFQALAARTTVGWIRTAWGRSVPVTTASADTVIGWGGENVPIVLHPGPLPATIAAGTRVGVLRNSGGTGGTGVAVRVARALPGPSVLWRLTRT